MRGWKRKERRVVHKTSYIEMWEDTVELPSGKVLDDFSGVTLTDGVLVVATDDDNRLIMFDEYKYAVNDTVLTFPAGGIDEGEGPLEAAKRELFEETGYSSMDGGRVLSVLYPYPSKITHKSYIVRIKNAERISDGQRSAIELDIMSDLQLLSLLEVKKLIEKGRFNTTYVLAALLLAFPGEL